MRKTTGLRNRYRRGGRSPYSRRRKAQLADYYGEYVNGRPAVPEKIRRWAQPETSASEGGQS